MKRIKLFLLFLLLLLVSGCTATFNVEINPAKVEQLVEIKMDKHEIKNDSILKTISDVMLDVEYDSESLGYYKTKEKIENGIGLLQATIDYPAKDYTSDHAIIYCYDDVSIEPTENGMNIKTSDEFICFDKYTMLDEVLLKVKVKGNVHENNADFVENGVYTWRITKDNALNHSIKLSIEWKEKSMIGVYVIGGILVFGILGLTLNFYLKYKKLNQKY